MSCRNKEDMPIRPRNGISETMFDDFYGNSSSTERMTSSYTEIEFQSGSVSVEQCNTVESKYDTAKEAIVEAQENQTKHETDTSTDAPKRPESLLCDDQSNFLI